MLKIHNLDRTNWALEKKDHVPGHPGTARILDPDWADLSRLKEWKRTCLESHGATCQNPLRIWCMRPEWLIDVNNRCLVRGNVADNYVALSYSYGRHRGMNIDASTLKDLQRPQALDAAGFTERLPPIVHHAMFLTSVIGENYLWIDELCIPHHDDEARAQQLEMMGAIYANAIITIISADGDACDGIRGLQGVSERRELRQVVVPFGNERLIRLNPETGNSREPWAQYRSNGLPYYNRGWTYQEYILSQRRILIDRNQLHWECSGGVWHEESVLSPAADGYTSLRPQSLSFGLPDLGSLNKIISDYNRRYLRYEWDALAGASGILSVLSRPFEGGFLYGIPEMFFDLYLRWRPDGTIERRVSSGKTFGSHQPASSLPSWSWVGWKGFVNFSFESLGRAQSGSVEETIPVTRWYTARSPLSLPSERRRIGSTWFENRERNKDPSRPLPPGWTRHEARIANSSRGIAYPDGCGEYLYTYGTESLDMIHTKWLYPFPVPKIDETTPPFTPEQTPYLFCETAGLELRAHLSYGNWTLLDGDGILVGWLVAGKEVLNRFGSHTSPKGRPVDVVAISKTRKSFYPSHKPPLKREDRYNVLWVELIDGVAYRLGIGEIEAAIWERLGPKKVSLVLG